MTRITQVVVAALFVVPLAIAEENQTVQGQIVLGNPITMVGPGVNEANPNAPSGIDGVWIALNVTATGIEPVKLSFSSTSSTADLDVRFYDATGEYIQYYGCETPFDNPEECYAPDGSTHALISGYEGVDVEFVFTYTYYT